MVKLSDGSTEFMKYKKQNHYFLKPKSYKETLKMGKLIFRYTDKDFVQLNREANKIEFDVPDDMDINEYKVSLC